MNLEESELFSSELAKTNKQKKTVLFIIIILSIILVFLIAATIMVKQKEANRFKTYYNGKETTFKPSFMKQADDGTYYISIKEMAALEGYIYNPGEYKKYEEVEESCNVSKDIEIVSLVAGRDYFYKTIDKTNSAEYTIKNYAASKSSKNQTYSFPSTAANGSVETYEIDKPVELLNGELYAPLDIISDIFNVRVVQKEKSISIQSLSYVYYKAANTIAEAGYTTMSGDFEDVKALIYDMAVISTGTFQGVLSLTNPEDDLIISTQYSELQFIQNSKEFLATATGNNNAKTVGLISSSGKMIIRPTQYDQISVLSDKNGLYLVKSGQNYGVLDRNGDIVVYVDYQEIGLDNMSDFPLEDTTNASVLFEKFIPVVDNGKYGLYNIEGVETLKPVYDSFGYLILTDEPTRELNVLSIPASLGIKGLVVKLNGYYGIYDMTTESLCVPCVFEKIYAETKASVTTYYLQAPGENPISLELFIEQNNLRNVDAEGNPIKSNDKTTSYVSDGETTEQVGEQPVTEEQPAIDLNPEPAPEVTEDGGEVPEETTGDGEETGEEVEG